MGWKEVRDENQHTRTSAALKIMHPAFVSVIIYLFNIYSKSGVPVHVIKQIILTSKHKEFVIRLHV